MTMKITQLRIYWDAGDANIVLEFLDDLRELILAAYGNEIIEMHQNRNKDAAQNGQTELPFDDQIEF
jgi:hypothetical protein